MALGLIEDIECRVANAALFFIEKRLDIFAKSYDFSIICGIVIMYIYVMMDESAKTVYVGANGSKNDRKH